MKTVCLVLIILSFGAAGFWYITENKRIDRAERIKRQELQREKEEWEEQERLERQRAEDERIRKERADAMAKEDAVRLFLNYVDREEDYLKNDIEELKLQFEKVCIDQQSLSDELKAIEEANAVRVAHAKGRGEQQRDKVKRVSALLKSETINRLGLTYCGEDFAALRAEFESEMQAVKDNDDRFYRQLKANEKAYEESVAGVDAKVDAKLKTAREKYELVTAEISKSQADLAKLQKSKTVIEREIHRIETKASPSNWERRKIVDLRKELLIIQNQLLQAQNITGLSVADMAHLEATEAEKEARRRYDEAGMKLTRSNDQATRERIHEHEVYNVACRFEDQSLSVLRQAINECKNRYANSMMVAKKKLAYLKKSAVNVDFLSKSEIEDLRRKISKSISDGIVVEELQ